MLFARSRAVAGHVGKDGSPVIETGQQQELKVPNDDVTLIDQILERITDRMVEETFGYREDLPLSLRESQSTELESTQLPANPRDAISQTGHDFIVRWETGGQSYYERVTKGRPEWPAFSSGITIGCGFDLGYHRLQDFQAQWNSRLAKADFDRLAQTIGFRTVEPNRSQKILQAKALVRSLSDIVVPWDTAIEQFDNSNFPNLIAQLYAALNNVDKLHPHCRGALLSLVFNRGAGGFKLAGDRFTEMRAISDLMTNGTPDSFHKIPGQLRSMKRIWGAASSLAERREGEAQLFEAGLKEAGLLESVSVASKSTLESIGATPPSEVHEAVQAEMTDNADEAEQEAILGASELESAGFTADSVRWNPVDDDQPDYRNLDTRLMGTTFELTPDDLDSLISANAFKPLAGKCILGLRGARLASGAKSENAASITVTDQRPNHRDFRCLLVVYDPDARRLWAYQASTVPNAAYVYKCYSDSRAGVSVENLTGNILLTGCYTMTVGTHRKGTRGEIPTVLRLSTSSSGASPVVVLRSLLDVTYDRFDRFQIATPADNIHPGQLSQGFSSAGCITLPGRYANGQHTGIWADFRAGLGIDARSDGRQFSLVLLTGLDAAMAANVRVSRQTGSTLTRLRFGSKGDAVARLQSALGLAPDSSQLIGPATRNALIKRQIEQLGWADGIYSPAMDELLGLKVWGSA
jgi:hypothetical protein